MVKLIVQFSPAQIPATKRSEVEMEIIFQNDGEQPLWVECDISAPTTLSLAPDKELQAGRTRLGIAEAKKNLFQKSETIFWRPDIYRRPHIFLCGICI